MPPLSKTLTLTSASRSSNPIPLCFINFSNSNLTNESVKSLSETLAKQLSLQNLHIDFTLYFSFIISFFIKNHDSCQNLTDPAISCLSSALKNLVSLKNLDLNFDTCQQLSDASVQSISQNLDKLTSLQNFALHFRE